MICEGKRDEHEDYSSKHQTVGYFHLIPGIFSWFQRRKTFNEFHICGHRPSALLTVDQKSKSYNPTEHNGSIIVTLSFSHLQLHMKPIVVLLFVHAARAFIFSLPHAQQIHTTTQSLCTNCQYSIVPMTEVSFESVLMM